MALTEEEMKERFMKFQTIQTHLEKLSEQAQLFNQHNAELDISTKAVQEIGKTKVDNEILAPVADGIFIKVKLLDNAKLVVNVGSNTTVERTVEEVVELLQKQKEEVGMKVIQVEAIMQELNSEAMKIYKEVEKEQEKQQEQ